MNQYLGLTLITVRVYIRVSDRITTCSLIYRCTVIPRIAVSFFLWLSKDLTNHEPTLFHQDHSEKPKWCIVPFKVSSSTNTHGCIMTRERILPIASLVKQQMSKIN